MNLVTVNFHVLRECDAKCKFCFATFRDVAHRLTTSDAERLVDALRAAGCEKINFAGGEPTLHRDLGGLIRHAKSLGMTTSIVTNGRFLGSILERHGEALDWVGLSVDSSNETVQRLLGRGDGRHARRAVALAALCRVSDVRVKLNTVVTSMTWQEDMSDLVARIAPERWKVFQVLRVEGENDGDVEDLLITAEQFDSFVERHRHLDPVVEDNAAMTDSYAMIDPSGRFYGNTNGVHRVSEPILRVGVATALESVGFKSDKLEARDGIYDWAPHEGRRRLPVIRASLRRSIDG